jgi:glycosyltransferase involved in cell wall biosynthesis
MRILARDNRVLWVDSIGYRAPRATRRDLGRVVAKLRAAARPLREVEPNLFVLSPIALPAYGSAAARAVSRALLRAQVRRAIRALGFERPVSWVFNPAAALVAGSLGEDLVVYYCVDEYTAFDGVPRAALAELERGLLARADLLVVSAERLLAAKPHPRSLLLRHGVDFEHFRRALDPATPLPADVARLPRPVIGYFGLMGPEWFDVPLVERVARAFPGGSVVLLGKVATDLGALPALPNVHVLGRKPYAELPAYAKAFDVGLVPFPVNEVTLAANPLKAREYLAAGLPVVATAIPEVTVLGDLVRAARGADDFVRAIEDALARPGSRAERSEAMRGESWEARVGELRGFVAAYERGRAPAGAV